MKKQDPNEQQQTMRGVVNLLTQLQELILIRDEQRSILAGTDLGVINKNIDDMVASLDPEVSTNFNRLYKKDHIFMAPMSDGSCSMCGMHLAISQIQSVKLCRQVVACPSCARIIYDPSGAKWVGEQKSRASGERKSGVARFSSPDLMIPDLRGGTAGEVIAELANSLEKAKFVDNAAKLVEGAIARESILGTGIGHYIAFPHVRGVEGGGLALAFGVSRKGVDFGGVAKTPSNLIFFCAIPTAVSAFYLRLLAGISDSFAKDANRKAALEADSPEALWKVLTKATRYTIK